jgi:hypothetical protein
MQKIETLRAYVKSKHVASLRSYFTTHPLFTISSPKTRKGEEYGYRTLILYLKPYESGGYGNICPMAKLAKCHEPCLNTSGHGAFNSTQEARQRRTDLFFLDREHFLTTIVSEIENHRHYCAKNNFKPIVRLNGTSDFPWEQYADVLMHAFPDVQFYEYTKIVKRMDAFLAGKMPKNYHLCYSLSVAPGSLEFAKSVIARGGNVAVVFAPKKVGSMPKSFAMPQFYSDIPVVDGDRSDLVFLNPPGTILGLRAKGQAKHDVSGFVVRV